MTLVLDQITFPPKCSSPNYPWATHRQSTFKSLSSHITMIDFFKVVSFEKLQWTTFLYAPSTCTDEQSILSLSSPPNEEEMSTFTQPILYSLDSKSLHPTSPIFKSNDTLLPSTSFPPSTLTRKHSNINLRPSNPHHSKIPFPSPRSTP